MQKTRFRPALAVLTASIGLALVTPASAQDRAQNVAPNAAHSASPASGQTSTASAAAPSAPVALIQGDGRQGTFKTIRGDVTLVKGSARYAPVVGDGLQASDRILTGRNSAASVVLKDGTLISVGPESSLDLAQFQFNTTTHEGNMLVSLTRGSMRMVTGLMAKLKPEQVTVTTPTSIIGVRGTDFIVEEKQ